MMSESEYRAIVIPTRNEARGIFKYLQIRSKTSIGRTQIYSAVAKSSGEKILLILSGIGPVLAHQAAEILFKQYLIKDVWILGVCAATQTGYEAGDAFIAQEVCTENSIDSILPSHPVLLEKTKSLFHKLDQKFDFGKILTVNRIIENPVEKIFLGQKYGCLGLEMEAFPIAQQAQEKNIPFIEIRWVLDPAEYTIPSTHDFVDPSGEAKAFAAFKSFAKNPPLVLQMIPFVQKVQKALKNMNQFLHSYFEDERIGASKF